MIYYKEGAGGQPFEQITLIHWDIINPKTLAGHYHQTNSLIGRIDRLRNKYKVVNLRKFRFYDDLLADNYLLLKALVVCKPKTLNWLIGYVVKKLKRLKLYNPKFLGELLNDAFQYENWRSNGKFEQLFEYLDINICPYCNHQDVFKDITTGLLVISCDHYIDKAKYPFLSLAFYNLIPVCKICNEGYKMSKPFRISTHIHPYLDDYDALGRFDHNFADGMLAHDITLNTADSRVKKSTLVLGIMERYAQQSVKSVSKNMYYYGKQYTMPMKQQLINDWGLMDLAQVEANICRMHDIPSNVNEIRNISLGKLKRDLARKYSLIP